MEGAEPVHCHTTVRSMRSSGGPRSFPSHTCTDTKAHAHTKIITVPAGRSFWSAAISAATIVVLYEVQLERVSRMPKGMPPVHKCE